MKSFHFGRNLRHCRQAQEYSQEYMAQLMGVSQSTYSRWEQSAEATIPQEQLRKIAACLNITEQRLIGAEAVEDFRESKDRTVEAEFPKQTAFPKNTKQSLIEKPKLNWIKRILYVGVLLVIGFVLFEFIKGFIAAFR